MANKGMYDLKIDSEFKKLRMPLLQSENQQLEKSILSEGCIDPIIVWNGYIIDGHIRYAICKSHGIPFEIKEAKFECKEVAIAWICLNQLKRLNLTEEMRHYLIGRQYDSERAAYWYSVEHTENAEPMSRTTLRRLISGRIAQENNVSRGTVEKYSRYSRAIDAIDEKHPEMVRKILMGHYKISHNNVEELAKLTPSELRKVQSRIEQMQQKDSLRFNQIRSILNNNTVKRQSSGIIAGTSVKDMPEFDPDAEVVGLTLTIPTWIRSVDRVMEKSDLTIVSGQAKSKLKHNIRELIEHLLRLISAIEEK